MSVVLLLGRISAAAQIRPVSSSAAKSTFSISCSGAMSQQMPQPWLATAWIVRSSTPASRISS